MVGDFEFNMLRQSEFAFLQELMKKLAYVQDFKGKVFHEFGIICFESEVAAWADR